MVPWFEEGLQETVRIQEEIRGSSGDIKVSRIEKGEPFFPFLDSPFPFLVYLDTKFSKGFWGGSLKVNPRLVLGLSLLVLVV